MSTHKMCRPLTTLWAASLVVAVAVPTIASAQQRTVQTAQGNADSGARLTSADHRAIRSLLKPGEVPVARAKLPGFGPGQTIMVVTQDFDQRRAFALTRVRAGKGVRWQRSEVPALHDNWVPWGQPKVVAGPKNRVAFMGEYLSGAGPTGAVPFQANAAMTWRPAQGFERSAPLTQAIEGIRDPRAVQRALSR